MTVDLLVRGGTVVDAASSAVLDIAVAGERIVAVEPPGVLDADGRRVIDATNCLVLPGGVDPHVHYNLAFGSVRSEPQRYSPAAAFGGTTTVVDFALQEPPASLCDAVAAKKAEAAGSMAVDYGLHAIITGPEVGFEVLDEIGPVVREGIPSIKTFMTYHWQVDDGARWGIMRAVAEAGGLSVVHAEDDAIARWQTAGYVRAGKTHGAYVAETRDALVEEAAVRRAMLLAERAGCPLYVLHMAAGAGVRALAEGRARGLPFFGETIVPYLSFTADALWQDPPRGLLHNNYPTPKSAADQAELWAALGDGRLDTVGSDHFATSADDHLERMGTTVDAMCAGHASVELRLPVLYHLGVAEGRISLPRFVDLVSTAPARLMGLYPRKGVLAEGSDADIVLLDPSATWTVRARDLHMSADYSCWEGWELRGQVRTTILRGTVLVDEGRWVGPRDAGRFQERGGPVAQI